MIYLKLQVQSVHSSVQSQDKHECGLNTISVVERGIDRPIKSCSSSQRERYWRGLFQVSHGVWREAQVGFAKRYWSSLVYPELSYAACTQTCVLHGPYSEFSLFRKRKGPSWMADAYRIIPMTQYMSHIRSITGIIECQWSMFTMHNDVNGCEITTVRRHGAFII